MPQWLQSALIGLAFGLVVSVLNHFILHQGMKAMGKLPADKGKNILVIRYGIRYLLNFVALILVHKNAPMLIATALGLTANRYVLIAKYLTTRNLAGKG